MTHGMKVFCNLITKLSSAILATSKPTRRFNVLSEWVIYHWARIAISWLSEFREDKLMKLASDTTAGPT